MRSCNSRRIVREFFIAAVLCAAGCPRSGLRDEAREVDVKLSLQPDPPKVGDVTATIRLTDKDGKPVRGADVKLEGNMNHAGMKPALATAKEADPGTYESTLNLSMGGDWFILIDASLADGRKLKRKIDVPGVRSR